MNVMKAIRQNKAWVGLGLCFVLAALLVYFSFSARPFSHRLAAFATDLHARSKAQRENILKATSRIHGQVLKSGETFSFNDKAGPYDASAGYLPERSYRSFTSVTTTGGGVCQVASTLYNAVTRSGLEILERVPHSGPVASVPRGWDATVAYGVADLKFRNTHPYPVKIVSRLVQDQLVFEVWGQEVSHE